MESNADKMMRKKLTNTEFPFDPQAWEQMETMLDQKKKRRAVFWWWFGGAGMAAALIGWILWNSNLNVLPESSTLTAAQTVSASTTSGSIAAEEITTSSAIVSTAENNASTLLSSPLQNTFAHKVGGTTEKHTITASEHNTNPLVDEQIAAHEKNTDIPLAVSINSIESEINYPLTAEAEQLTTTQVDSALNELPLTTDGAEVDLPIKKISKFAYSLGLLANISGSSVGKQTAKNNVGSTPFFYHQPSFAFGFSNDFLFVNRVGLSTGLFYAQTSFRIEKPRYTITDSVGTIRNFKTEIRELQIPLMVKGYFYRSKVVSLFASVGVINHIKLKEKFTLEYEVPIALNSIPPIATATDVQTIQQYNSFTPIIENNTPDFSTAKSSTSGESFGMGGTKRYYASVYTSMGVEFNLAKQILLSAEPMYFFSAQKIGQQPQRKHNLGLNVGLRYLFSVR